MLLLPGTGLLRAECNTISELKNTTQLQLLQPPTRNHIQTYPKESKKGKLKINRRELQWELPWCHISEPMDPSSSANLWPKVVWAWHLRVMRASSVASSAECSSAALLPQSNDGCNLTRTSDVKVIKGRPMEHLLHASRMLKLMDYGNLWESMEIYRSLTVHGWLSPHSQWFQVGTPPVARSKRAML